MNLPNGAKAVVDARKRGFKPAEMLIISLIGKVNEANHTIYASPDAEYDWRWLVGLQACIYIKPGVIWKPITMKIALANPQWLGVYDADLFCGSDVMALPFIEDIEKPKSQWRHRLDFLPWLKFQNEEFAFGGM